MYYIIVLFENVIGQSMDSVYGPFTRIVEAESYILKNLKGFDRVFITETLRQYKNGVMTRGKFR